jgi:hypothetical protein
MGTKDPRVDAYLAGVAPFAEDKPRHWKYLK